MNKNDFWKKLSGYDNYFITSHLSPDVDAACSSLALRSILTRILKKNVKIFSTSRPHPSLCFFEEIYLIEVERSLPQEPNTAIINLDSGGLEKADYAEIFKTEETETFRIDHHIPKSPFAKYEYIDCKSSSTSEILFDILEANKISPNQQEANYILAGIMYDTMNFQHETASFKTFECAAKLIEAGANMPQLQARFKCHNSHEKIIETGKLLSAIRLNPSLKVVSAQTKDKKSTSSDISSIMSRVAEADVSMLISKNRDDSISFSLRSDKLKKNAVDVNKIASHFGGGGHKYAAGFSIKGNLENYKIT